MKKQMTVDQLRAKAKRLAKKHAVDFGIIVHYYDGGASGNVWAEAGVVGALRVRLCQRHGLAQKRFAWLLPATWQFQAVHFGRPGLSASPAS